MLVIDGLGFRVIEVRIPLRILYYYSASGLFLQGAYYVHYPIA